MVTTTFAELGLSPKVQAAIDAAGYTNPTPIQAEAIPVALTGQDVLGIAQTGTGKTASFVLPMITRLEKGRARARMPRSLILAPTRELAAQVAQSFENYGVNHKLNLALLIGGVSMDEQTRKLDRGVDVLIATPGRLIDHFQRGRIMLMGVEILVIDEADRMLDMGFIPDIEKICKLLPPRRQTLFFSATMPPEITRLVDQFLTNPQRIEVAKQATTAKTITQRFSFCADGEDWAKRDMLRELIRSDNVKNAIIFCNRKRDVAILHKSLTKHGFNAGALHGDMDQKARTDTLDKFRSGEITILAASDVAARGLDIPDVSHVFNFDLPWQSEDYVHRIGRTGRAGKEGRATSIVTHEDIKLLDDIQKITGDEISWIGDGPTDEDRADAASRKRRRGGRTGGKTSSSRSGSQARGPSGRSRGSSGRDSSAREETRSARSDTVSQDAPETAREQSAEKRDDRAANGRQRERPQELRRKPRDRGDTNQSDNREEIAGAIPGPIPGQGEQPDVISHSGESAAANASQSQSKPDQQNRDGDTPPKNTRRRSRGGRSRSGKGEGARQDGARQADTQQARNPESKPTAAARSKDNGGDEADQAKPSKPRKSASQTITSAPAAGFADNVPAFLRRPVRKPAAKKEETSEPSRRTKVAATD